MPIRITSGIWLDPRKGQQKQSPLGKPRHSVHCETKYGHARMVPPSPDVAIPKSLNILWHWNPLFTSAQLAYNHVPPAMPCSIIKARKHLSESGTHHWKCQRHVSLHSLTVPCSGEPCSPLSTPRPGFETRAQRKLPEPAEPHAAQSSSRGCSRWANRPAARCCPPQTLSRARGSLAAHRGFS